MRPVDEISAQDLYHPAGILRVAVRVVHDIQIFPVVNLIFIDRRDIARLARGVGREMVGLDPGGRPLPLLVGILQ